MINETQKSPEAVADAPGYKEKIQAPPPAALPSLEESLKKLAKYGGFNVIKATIAGTESLNPASKALRNIFLTDGGQKAKDKRDALKNRLDLWAEVLQGQEKAADLVGALKQKTEELTSAFNTSLKSAVEASRTLEQSYRSLDLFYKNTGQTKVKNVSILNASLDQLTNLENPTFIDAVERELRTNYDRIDLKYNYSLLVVPGYLGEKMVVDKWARMAHQNKVTLVTDFANLESEESVVALFSSEELASGDPYLANVIMTCNWLVGRGKYETLGEEEDLHLPPSAAMAGKMYANVMSQPSAGVTHGYLNEVAGVRFKPLKSEAGNLEKLGLVPFCYEFNKVFSFSAKTLFNGNNVGLQTYSVVRVFDYLSKVSVDFLNRSTFKLIDEEMTQDLEGQLQDFLESVKGKGKLIEKGNVQVVKDDRRPDRVNIKMNITPYFPARTFVLKMDGTKGDASNSSAEIA